MVIKKAYSIDELYERCQGYDFVLTADTPLADALNSRIDRARLGRLAFTPRGLVYQQNIEAEGIDRRHLFLELIDRTDLSWKEGYYYLENVLHCWQETGSIDEILEYDRFNPAKLKKVIEILRNTPNLFKSQAEFEWKNDSDVAVIAPHQFRGLDRCVLPENYTKIDAFKNEPLQIENFSIYPSSAAIVETIVDNLQGKDPADIAIVIDPGSQYQSLLESSFRSRAIPYIHKTHLSEKEAFRNWLQLMRLSLENHRLRLRDLQPFLRWLGTSIPSEKNRRYFRSIEDEAAVELRSFLNSVENNSFYSVIDKFEKISGADLGKLKEVIREIGFSKRRVNRRCLNLVEFYLNSFNVVIDEDQTYQGVLLASPLAGAYVDRPLVFFVGMDSSWTRQVAQRPWIDVDESRQANLKDFQLMLQNGQRRCYLVQDVILNRQVAPCFYFNALLEDEISSFADLPNDRYSRESKREKIGFEPEGLESDFDKIKTISQSALNSFVRCPREYYFSRLVPTQENRHLRKGSLYHDFAEFYLLYPDFVRKHGREKFAALIVEELQNYVDELEKYSLEVEAKVALSNLMAYLDENSPSVPCSSGEGEESPHDENFFADFFNMPVKTDVTEVWFNDPALGTKGKIDLLQAADHILDYKSGKKSSSSAIVKRANVSLIEKNVDFQSILYLTYYRRRNPEKTLKFTFFHFLDNLTDIIAGQADVEETLVTITYYPRKFKEQIGRQETFDYLIAGVADSNNRRKTLEGIGYELYREFFSDRELPDFTDRDKIKTAKLLEEFIEYARDIFKDVAYVERGCRSAFKKLVNFRINNFFEEDLDGFESFLKERLNELNGFMRERFPVRGWLEDFDIDDVHNRDLIRDDRYGT